MKSFFTFIICIFYCMAGYGQENKGVAALMTEANKHKNQPLYAVYLLQADSVAEAAGDEANQAVIHEKLGFYHFSRDAAKSIEHYDRAFKFYTELGQHKKAAFCSNNIAFVFDEGMHNNKHALEAAQIALQLWQQQDDTMQQANMYKYIGLLQGRLGQYAPAKRSIDTAIRLFTAQKFIKGVAVSYFDMANVLLDEKDIQGAIASLEKAKNIWQQYGDSARIYTVNTVLLKAMCHAGKKERAKQVLTENLAIEQAMNIYWSNRLDFYKEAEVYAGLVKEKQDLEELKAKRRSLSDSLINAGIAIQ